MPHCLHLVLVIMHFLLKHKSYKQNAKQFPNTSYCGPYCNQHSSGTRLCVQKKLLWSRRDVLASQGTLADIGDTCLQEWVPVYMESTSTGSKDHPPSRDMRYERKVDPFSGAKSTCASSYCLTGWTGESMMRKVGPARRVTLPSKKLLPGKVGHPASRADFLFPM